MNKRILKILVIVLLIIPIMVKAASVKYRPDAINKANNYIRLAKFSDRKKYIDLDTDKYVYEDGYITSISDYKTGGMLSKTEYELSKTGDMSYLTLGQKYWTLTPAGSGKRYYVENYLDDKAESEEAGVRSTIFAKSEVYVVGKGTYNIPWEFKLFHTVKITPKAYGSIECIEGNCKKVKTTVVKDKIESGSDASFKVIPDDGYKYLANDSCNLKRTSGQNYKISNITSDIRCIVEFYPRTYTLKLMPGTGVQYRQNPGKDKIYLKYTVGTFSDPDAKNPLTFVSPPTRIGYQFRGYYYGDTKVIEDNGTIIESQRKGITGFNLAGEDIQELVAHWEPNKIHITFDPNEGVDYNTAQHQIPVTVTRLYDETNYSGTDGLPNYACSKDACWWGLSRTGYHGTNFWLVDSKTETSSTPKINVNTSFAKNQDMFTGTQKTSFEDNYNTNVTLYAQWIQCAEGTYMDEEASGTSCKSCPAGTFQPNTTQGSCTECAVASITTSQGQTSCTPCQPSGATGSSGTTSSRGQTSCNDSCNKTHVSTWKNQIWTNNSTSPICEINSCVDGYHIEDNTCVPNELVITYNANGGADQRGTNSIPYTVTLKYDGTTYSGSSGLPNYSCTSECFWNLSRGGYHGTSDWLVGSTTSTTKINANTAFATNQDVASAIGKLDDFKTKASTTVNLYAEWIKCNEGKFNPSDRSGTTCVDCAIGSITSSKGQSSCSACQPSGATGSNGTTSTVGLSSCDTSCNKSNVGEWETQEWTNNKTEPICQIKSCATGYSLNTMTNTCDSAKLPDPPIYVSDCVNFKRYTGSNPSNYICFGTSDLNTCLNNKDNYLYRIIGMDSNEIKLLKWLPIGKMSNDNNIWNNNTIKNKINDSSYLTNTTYVPSGWSNVILKHQWQYRTYGMQYGVLKLVDSTGTTNNTTTNLSDSKAIYYSAANMCLYEHGTTSEISLLSAKVGLLNASDIFYSRGGTVCTDNSPCARGWMSLGNTYTMEYGGYDDMGSSSYDLFNCAYKRGPAEWTMAHRGYCNNGCYQMSHQFIRAGTPNNKDRFTDSCSIQSTKMWVRPVIYISRNTSMIGGDGSASNPYLITP